MRSILVREVMSRSPAVVPADMTVREGAELMKKRGISTLIVESDGNYVGIVTERDMITKIVAEGNDPAETTLRDIMSHPVVMISQDESISTAARVMSRRRIRKLPVIRGKELVGLLSENDIVRIAPDLIALAREYARIHRNHDYEENPVEYVVGRCEACGQYSLRLRQYQGMLVCPECYESMQI
ncbi:MAG: CBS domain-containing protein [Euryarchaeota archaeon]|nr:CBS domain-containing protein [Euryarchaeota archaeon]